MTPVQSFATFATLLVFFLVIGGSIVAWSRWIAKVRTQPKSDNLVRCPQATVGFVDIVGTIVMLIVLFFFASIAWRSSEIRGKSSIAVAIEYEGTESGQTDKAESNFRFSSFLSSAQLVCVCLMTMAVVMRTGCSLKKLGWRSDQLASDMRAGLQCYLMMTPPILLLSAILQQVTQIEYDHPVIQMIQKYPWLLGFAFWQASIVAPISEEFAFRVLILGWFESIHFAKEKAHAFLFGLKIKDASPQQTASGLFELMGVPSPNLNNESGQLQPYAPPISALERECEDGVVIANQPAPWWPAILSGSLFGLAHFSYGVSWVPLMVMGVVLGRLYQTRQSVIPVIVVHMLFNSTSLIMLGLGILLPHPVPE